MAWRQKVAETPARLRTKPGEAQKRRAADDSPEVGLRHTYASRLALRDVPLAAIAAQLGHSDTRMVEKDYGHLAPSYIADTMRAAFGSLGIVEPSNVAPIAATRYNRQRSG